MSKSSRQTPPSSLPEPLTYIPKAFSRAKQLLSQQKYEEATNAFRWITQVSTDVITLQEAHLGAAQCAEKQGNIKTFNSHFLEHIKCAQTLQNFPYLEKLYRLLGNLHFESQHYPIAIDAFHFAISYTLKQFCSPDPAIQGMDDAFHYALSQPALTEDMRLHLSDLMENLATAYYHNGNLPFAIRMTEYQLAFLEPTGHPDIQIAKDNLAFYHYTHGVNLHHNGHYSEAIPFLQKAVDHYNLLNHYSAGEQTYLYMESCHTALENMIEAQEVRGWAVLSRVYGEQANIHDAITQLALNDAISDETLLPYIKATYNNISGINTTELLPHQLNNLNDSIGSIIQNYALLKNQFPEVQLVANELETALRKITNIITTQQELFLKEMEESLSALLEPQTVGIEQSQSDTSAQPLEGGFASREMNRRSATSALPDTVKQSEEDEVIVTGFVSWTQQQTQAQSQEEGWEGYLQSRAPFSPSIFFN